MSLHKLNITYYFFYYTFSCKLVLFLDMSRFGGLKNSICAQMTHLSRPIQPAFLLQNVYIAES